MLKKLILLIVILLVITGVAIGVKKMSKKETTEIPALPAVEVTTPKSTDVAAPKAANESAKPADKAGNSFGERMKLTPAQNKLNQEGLAKVDKLTKGITEQINAKKAELEKVKNSSAPEKVKAAQIDKLNKDLTDLNNKYGNIFIDTMATFEASLSPAQKAELAKIKEEMFKNQKK